MASRSRIPLLLIVLGMICPGHPALGDNLPPRAIAADGSFIALTGRDLRAAYQMNVYLRNQIADRLDQCWSQEHEISSERDRLGRAGDAASVTQLERDLLAVRQQIDRLRQDLTSENRILALIDRQMSWR